MADNCIGTCSLCEGPVIMPSMMVYPEAYCERCGARQKNPYGPVIQMKRTSPFKHTTVIYQVDTKTLP